MTTLRAGLGILVVATAGSVWACSLSASSLDAAGGANADPNRGTSSSGGSSGESATPAGAADLAPTDNGVIMVHAASMQPFRMCFENQLGLYPQPDKQAMPQANVVGVEVGHAVRISPLNGPPGHVYLYEEPLIRGLYFGSSDGKGPTCSDLHTSNTLSALEIDLGEVKTDLSKGVHLLVVKGCPKDTASVKHSVAECGADWTAATGNLSVAEITLPGANRKDLNKLPTQVVNLSPAVETARGGKTLSVTFGALATPGKLTPVVDNPALFKDPQPTTPVSLDFASDDLSTYATNGFRVTVPSSSGGSQVDVDYSLAEIQKASSPLEVPSSYYTVASNYVLLLLGDPNAKLPDGGPDSDERRALHFLAVPVIEPKAANDAGPGTDAAADGP